MVLFQFSWCQAQRFEESDAWSWQLDVPQENMKRRAAHLQATKVALNLDFKTLRP